MGDNALALAARVPSRGQYRGRGRERNATLARGHVRALSSEPEIGIKDACASRIVWG